MLKFKLNQLRKNILSGSAVHGLNILLVFFSYPLTIHFLGFEQFSVWVLLSIIITFAQFGDFGIGKAIINYVATYKESNREDEISNILQNGLIIVFIISLFVQLGISLFTNEIIYILNIPEQYVIQSRFVIPLIGISIFTYLTYDCIANVLTGLGRLDLYNILLLFLNFTKISLSLLLLAWRPFLDSMVYGVLLSNILFLLIIVIILLNLKISFRFRFGMFNLVMIKQLIRFGIPLLGIQVVNILMFPFIKIIISRFFGIDHVGFFELATKAAYSFRTLFEKGLFALLPEFSRHSELYFADEKVRQSLRHRVSLITKKILLYGIPFLIVISLSSHFLLKLWLGPSFNNEIYYGFLSLQPGIIVGLIALPSYYALMAMRKQAYCLLESVIRLVFTFLVFSVFLFTSIDYFMVFILVSIVVVISNSFILFSFKYRV